MIRRFLTLFLVGLSARAADKVTTILNCTYRTIVTSGTSECDDPDLGRAQATINAKYVIPGYPHEPVTITEGANVFPNTGHQEGEANIHLTLSTAGTHMPGFLHVIFSNLASTAIFRPFAQGTLTITLAGNTGGCTIDGMNVSCSFPGFAPVTLSGTEGSNAVATITGEAILPFTLGTNFTFEETLNISTFAGVGLDGFGTGLTGNVSFYVTDAAGTRITIQDGNKKQNEATD